MSFQKCPVCEGCGFVGIGFPTGKPCDVCHGQKIIDTQTGQPPYKISTTTGTSPQFNNLEEYAKIVVDGELE